MTLFDVVGGDLFRALTSQYKEIYLDCLIIIYNSYRSELSYGVDREMLVLKLTDYFETSVSSEIQMESDAEILRDSRAKASSFLRNLKEFGWVEYEITNNYSTRVVMPNYAVSLVRTFLDIANPKEMEYQSEIAVIYSTLTNEELLASPYPQVLKPVFDRTRALFDGLKKLNTSIKNYIDDITAEKTAEEILRDFFTYHDEIGSKAYHRIKTEENISRFRNTIVGRLRDLLNNPEIFDRLVRGYQNIENENTYYTAEDEVKMQIASVIDSFRSYDEIVSDIDRKHSKYIRSAVERAKFLLLNTNNVEGKISTILQYMAECFNEEDQSRLGEDASSDILSMFNIFPQGFLSDASLKAIPVSRIIEDVEEIDMDEIEEAVREAKRLALLEKNKNSFSMKNIERFVGSLLADQRMVLASEVPIETKRDFIRLIFIRLYGCSAKSNFVAVRRDDKIDVCGFRFLNFEIKRRYV